MNATNTFILTALLLLLFSHTAEARECRQTLFKYPKVLGTLGRLRLKLQTSFGLNLNCSQKKLIKSLAIVSYAQIRFFKKHLKRDTLEEGSHCTPCAEDLFGKKVPNFAPRYLSGDQRYGGGIYTAPYRYIVQKYKGKFVVDVPIHISLQNTAKAGDPWMIKVKNTWCAVQGKHIPSDGCYVEKGSAEAKKYKQWMLKGAASYWNKQKAITYRFSLVEKKSQATLSIPMIDGPTRGPYFSRWSTHWNARTLAHEIGHQMGLNDEYRESSPSCEDSASIMCEHHVMGRPQIFHHYLIMRRALCSKALYRWGHNK